MSNTFYDIMNNFNSEDEDEVDDEEYDNPSNQKLKRKSTSSLAEDINIKIKEKLINEQREEESNENRSKTKRDQFGYFITNEENDDSEESNSNNDEKSQKSNNESEYQENENQNSNSKEENIKNNEDIDLYNNQIINKSNNLESENKEYINIENSNNNKDEDIYEQVNNENEEQNDLINELYNKSIKHENLDSIEGEGFRMNSFRPNPIQGSPKFTKRETLNSTSLKNTDNFNNNSINNFTETIETKIEGESPDINTFKENSIKTNKNNQIYTHSSNIISLGKLPNKENINTSESIEKIKNFNNKIEENNSDNNDNEEKEEEAFLKREELKRQKYKEDMIVNKDDEEKGKENVTEDEEDTQTQVLNKLNIQENLENLKYFRNKKEKLKEEVTEDDEEEENHKINNFNNFSKKSSKNEISDKDISIKLSHRYEKIGSERQSKNNNINNTNNKIMDTVSKKVYQKNLVNIPKSRNSKYNSPSNKYIKYNNKTTDNKKIVISTIKKNTSFKMDSNYNSNLSKKNSLKNKKELESIKKNLYSPRNDAKSKLYEPLNSNKNINNTPDKYSFLPNINQKSREICEKKDNKRPTTPIGILLYEEANNQKEKLNQICLTENNKIKSNANIKKINNNSYNMAIDRINKRIDNSIKKYSKKGKLSIVGLAQCLFELNIITELIKIKDNIQEVNNDLDFVELQSIIESINGKDYKKLGEVEFLEQLWFIINPSQTNYINCMILSEILKILLSSNNNKKDLSNAIGKIFEKYKIKENEKNNEEKEDYAYKSPLRDKQYNKNELWPLSKFIKTFLNLKQNLKAYKDNDHQKGDIYNNIIKERDKDLTFQPDFSSNALFYKYSKYNYKLDNSGIKSPIINFTSSNSPRNQKVEFEKVYKRFMEEKQLHEKTLERLREIKQEKELKMCTNVPKINKYIPPSSVKMSFKKKKRTIESEGSPTLQKNNSSFDIKLPIYKKLYNLKKDYKGKSSNNNVLDENCTFKPNITTDTDILNKTFSNMKNMKKPKGYNEYVKRNRSILEKKENDKKMEEDKKYGKNYEKIQKLKLKPFNITDLNGSGNKKKKTNIPIPSSNRKKSQKDLEQIYTNNKPVNNFDNEKIENIIDDVYITIDIKIPNGLLKPLKIYNKNYNDTLEVVNNFCKIYSINDENKKIILKKVMQYKNTFFGRNLLDNKDGFILNEDLDTITNTYSNNSNH